MDGGCLMGQRKQSFRNKAKIVDGKFLLLYNNLWHLGTRILKNQVL